jgi:hypothetical protein
MRRTLGAIAFFKVRHTITIENGYFILQRDLGMAVSVWNLKSHIGSSKETAEQVSVAVESGGNYLFRIWIDEDRKELYMESAPERPNEGVTTVQTRSLIDNDLMKMVRFLLFPSSPPLLHSTGLAGTPQDRRERWSLISKESTQMLPPRVVSSSGISSIRAGGEGSAETTGGGQEICRCLYHGTGGCTIVIAVGRCLVELVSSQ